MKRTMVLVFVMSLMTFIGSSISVDATSETVDSSNTNQVTAEQIEENEAAIKEKEQELEALGLLIDTEDFQAQLLISQRKNYASVAEKPYYTIKKLAVIRVEQENRYYCGPAAVKMVLDYKGIYRTQRQIASAVGTSSEYGTSAYNMSVYLKNLTGYNYVTQKISNRPVANVKSTIDSNYPVIYNVKTQSINKSYTFDGKHHITGHGYRMYTDPNSTSTYRLLTDGVVNAISPKAVLSYVTDLYYYDPWTGDYAKGEKMISVSQLTAAIKANHGLYIW